MIIENLTDLRGPFRVLSATLPPRLGESEHRKELPDAYGENKLQCPPCVGLKGLNRTRRRHGQSPPSGTDYEREDEAMGAGHQEAREK